MKITTQQTLFGIHFLRSKLRNLPHACCAESLHSRVILERVCMIYHNQLKCDRMIGRWLERPNNLLNQGPSINFDLSDVWASRITSAHACTQPLTDTWLVGWWWLRTKWLVFSSPLFILLSIALCLCSFLLTYLWMNIAPDRRHVMFDRVFPRELWWYPK